MNRRIFIAAVLVAASIALAARLASETPDVPARAAASDRICLASDRARPSELPARSLAAAHRFAHREAPWIELGRYWLQQVHTYPHRGGIERVEACAESALARLPDSLAAAELRASARLNRHDFVAAVQAAEAILQRDPDHIAAWGIKSDALLELGQWQAASAATAEQMRRWPGAPAQARAAFLHWLRGDSEAAKRSLVEALRGRAGEAPGFEAWLWQELAQVFWQEGDLAGADALYQRALSRVPQYAPALLGRARIALASQRPAHARQFAEAAAAAGAGFPSSVLLGDIALRVGDADGAEQHYQRAEQIGRRGDPIALARFLAERGRDPRRAQRILQSFEDRPAGIALGEARAWAHLSTGACPRARADLAPLLVLGTRDAERWRLAASIEIACGDPARGQQWMSAARALNPTLDASLPMARAADRDLEHKG